MTRLRHYIYMVDEEEKLVGVLSLLDLIMAASETNLKDIVTEDVVRVKDNDNIDEAIGLAAKYNFLSLPVIDGDENVCAES